MQSTEFDRQRARLVDREFRELGISNEAVLNAMRAVPREQFVSEEMQEFAYRNTALPIASGQTISQPSMVAAMIQLLNLDPDDRVLEVGTGSGYAAAVLSHVCREVFTIERLPDLAESASTKLASLGSRNIHVRKGDGTLGWPEKAPFDAIVVAAAGPQVPPALLEQLDIGGRLVIPIGECRGEQKLLRIVKHGQDDFEQSTMSDVMFVPLIGQAGWKTDGTAQSSPATRSSVSTAGTPPRSRSNTVAFVQDAAEAFASIDSVDLKPLLDRISDARVVLIGEASHGTSEFYRMRARITQALIELKGFRFVAIEADWPDAHRIHEYVTHKELKVPHNWQAFARFPTWMWRNHEVLDFIEWLHQYNSARQPREKVGFYGLDLYSLYTSIHQVIRYLEQVDPMAAAIARKRYGCLSPWEEDPAHYGHVALNQAYRSCEQQVVQMLRDMLARQMEASTSGEEALFDAQVNAQVIANAEAYYRALYKGDDESWNARDRHMFGTLNTLLRRYGGDAKAVVWEHNSHLGNAAATQFGRHGQINVGQLCREQFGDSLYAIGQGTDHGEVAAASDWDGPMQIKSVRPALAESYERLMHVTEIDSFFLPLGGKNKRTLSTALTERLERAIGVIYRPETERQSHYFQASLPQQFDEWIWFDETSAISPLVTKTLKTQHESHPFANVDR